MRYWKSVIVALVAAIVCVVIIAGINTVRRPSADGLQVASIKGDAARVKALLSSNRSLAVERGYRNYTSLHWAAMGGHYQVAKLLLDNGAEANAVSEENVSPLYLAALAGHSELVRLLLSHGADTGLHCHYSGIYHRGSGSGNIYPGYTPLHAAAESGDVRCVQLLLKAGANPHTVDERNDTPLHIAAALGHREAVRELLSKGAKVGALNGSGITPLDGANDSAVADILLQHGADPNAGDGAPLNRASFAGNVSLVKLLLEHEADPNHRNKLGETPLIAAVQSLPWTKIDPQGCDRKAVIDLLIAHGASVKVRDKNGLSPTWMAAAYGRRDLAETLRAHGGKASGVFVYAAEGDVTGMEALLRKDPSVVRALDPSCGCKDTPLHRAAELRQLAVATLLLNNGADINAKDLNGKTPLASAIENRDEPMAKLLLSHGASVSDPHLFLAAAGSQKMVRMLNAHGAKLNVRRDGSELLLSAALTYDRAKVDFFIRAGAKIDPKAPDYRTGMQMIVTRGGELPPTVPDGADFRAITDLLFKNGASVNARDSDGRTLLHNTAMNPIVSGSVECLLQNGADVNAIDSLGLTPLQYSTDPETIRTLLLHGAAIAPSKAR